MDRYLLPIKLDLTISYIELSRTIYPNGVWRIRPKYVPYLLDVSALAMKLVTALFLTFDGHERCQLALW